MMAAKALLNSLSALVEKYREICGKLPDQQLGLNALLMSPDSKVGCKAYPLEGILREGKLPSDPWGNGFLYTTDGSKFTIKSLGKDGKEGGEGVDKDIVRTN